MARTALLVNANSRLGARWFQEAINRLGEAGLQIDEKALFKNPRRMSRAVALARDAAFDTIIIGGGDGTMNAAAGILAGSNCKLGVLPLGTGNSFARDLGIPSDVRSACAIIAAGHVHDIDLGRIDGRPFLNVATMGLSAILAASMKPLSKRLLGPISYLGPLLQAVLRIKPFEARIISEGIDETFPSMQVVIGNGRYHAGPFLLSPEANISSGSLVVYGVTSDRRSQLLRYAIRLIKGELQDAEVVRSFHLKHGRIETLPAKTIIVDGERGGRTPANFDVWHGALKVIAPVQVPGASP